MTPLFENQSLYVWHKYGDHCLFYSFAHFNSNFHLGCKHQTMTLGATDILCSNKKPSFPGFQSSRFFFEFHARWISQVCIICAGMTKAPLHRKWEAARVQYILPWCPCLYVSILGICRSCWGNLRRDSFSQDQKNPAQTGNTPKSLVSTILKNLSKDI